MQGVGFINIPIFRLPQFTTHVNGKTAHLKQQISELEF